MCKPVCGKTVQPLTCVDALFLDAYTQRNCCFSSKVHALPFERENAGITEREMEFNFHDSKWVLFRAHLLLINSVMICNFKLSVACNDGHVVIELRVRTVQWCSLQFPENNDVFVNRVLESSLSNSVGDFFGYFYCHSDLNCPVTDIDVLTFTAKSSFTFYCLSLSAVLLPLYFYFTAKVAAMAVMKINT